MEAKPLKYKSLNGISEKQLSEHHDVLYAGYVKKVNDIREKLAAADKSDANATFSMLRELKLEEGFALNGVKLHEIYFANLGGDGIADGKILELIKKDFGSFEAWQQDFIACGMSARGWVVLAFDWAEHKLRNFICDMHNQGGIWDCCALLVLDVYEHAYFIDYATARKKYLEVFMKNIDWEYVDSEVRKRNIDKIRCV